jgi:hypothetical protein
MMQKKMKTDEYDVTKNMLKTIRTLTESKVSSNVINENQTEFQTPQVNTTNDENQKNDIDVINDVDVKLLSSDQNDLKLTDQQKTAISELIDGFKQQVSQIVEFEPGMTLTREQIRLDGYLPDEDINFVFISGKESGVYINADMLKLEQDVATSLEKLAKFEITFKSAMDPIIQERTNN